ncbi:sensor histidine kinase [Cohnella mopanensis]|uniref:sensor histidine kinase n=1 Tax=Cohnella mopanensis TaxID=2911966 RepID=UPI001EF7BDCF|nr:ATP-binding protein [Cohnella mopanensis]
MKIFKSTVIVLAAAALIFALNGWVNYGLMHSLNEVPGEINSLRSHLEEPIFSILFLFIGIVFLGMLAVLPKEKGYLYLGIFSFLVSLQLFVAWEEKSLLFGDFPDISYASLAIKSGIVWLAFAFMAYMLGMTDNKWSRLFVRSSGGLAGVIIATVVLEGREAIFILLNFMFLAIAFCGMAFYGARIFTLLRQRTHQDELQWVGKGVVLFMIVLLPDLGKDLLEYLIGHSIGYQPQYWEQCLEDTFSWAFLELVAVFGILFLRRFIRTLIENKSINEQLTAKNVHLEQEVRARQRLDQMLTVFTRAYRIADLEQSALREGNDYFQPHSFHLVKFNEAKDEIRVEGGGIRPSQEREILSLLQAGGNFVPGDTRFSSSVHLSAAGGVDGAKLFLLVSTDNAALASLEERERFALVLMAKYVAIFHDYLRMIDGRLIEIEQNRTRRQPWLSKLFMQMAEKERRRLASDLHDDVLQEILNIRRSLDRTIGGTVSDGEKEKIRTGLDNAEFMIRETCQELMPSFISEHGAVHAISKLVEKMRLRADFQLEFHGAPPSKPLSDEQNTTIYRIVQELINNALKHSNARVVKLEMEQVDSVFYIRYADDGKGMDTALDFATSDRFGLKGIAERVRLVDGSLSLDSRPSHGMKAVCALPI